MNLVLCLPGNNFSGKFLDCLIDFYHWCVTSGISVGLSRRENSNVYFVRNQCLGANNRAGEFQKPWQGNVDYDYTLWIDSDIIWTPQDFQKLYALNTDIASGLYLMDSNNMFPNEYSCVEHWDETYFQDHGRFEFLTKQKLAEKKSPFPVNYVGFGFMLVKRGVNENLQYPWFRPIFKRTGTAYDFCSEDVGWCHQALDKGYKIMVHPEVVVGHEKKIILR